MIYGPVWFHHFVLRDSSQEKGIQHNRDALTATETLQHRIPDKIWMWCKNIRICIGGGIPDPSLTGPERLGSDKYLQYFPHRLPGKTDSSVVSLLADTAVHQPLQMDKLSVIAVNLLTVLQWSKRCSGEIWAHMGRSVSNWGWSSLSVCVWRYWQFLELFQCMNINIWIFPYGAKFKVSGIFWHII